MSDGGGIDARIMLPKAVHSDAIQTLTKEDFKIEVIIMTDGKQYYVCIGDGCHHHSGKKSPIVFEES